MSVSAFENPLLVEKTDREGLTDSSAAGNFLRLIREVVAYANHVNNHIRRGIVAYEKEASLADAKEARLDEETVDRRLSRARSAASKVRGAKTNGNDAPVSLEDVDDLEKAVAIAQALKSELERVTMEMQKTMELAAVGLTAEALSHEIANITEQLSQRTKAIATIVDRPDANPRLVDFVEHVRGVAAALRKQLAHIAPSLRYARERRERFDVREFVNAVAGYYRDRLDRKAIRLIVDCGAQPLVVKTSRGKLTQVMDNLILNSEYWLEEQDRKSGSRQGAIKIAVRETHLVISDNGPGIDTAIEESLFEPFVTLKSQGRGLGLFITRQLLDSMGCSIRLKAARNPSGRRYVFDIDMAGAVEGED